MLEKKSRESNLTYNKIEKAIKFMEKNKTDNISLKDIARYINMSEYHFHRLFTVWVGTTPDRFFRYIKKEYLLNQLKAYSIFETTYRGGLSNPSRMFDLLVTYEALTPGEFKQKGENVTIFFGFHDTPFGNCYLAVTGRGILELTFVAGKNNIYLNSIQKDFPLATIVEKKTLTSQYINTIFTTTKKNHSKPLHLLLRGTNFQIKVWEALLKLPFGALTSYYDIAKFIGNPYAFRAVGKAIGSNPIAYLIPCHRVIEKVGNTGNYRWGIFRKKAMLGWEMALTSKS
jgi:AraC family transcriptional regulator of adaptative response/methylated-DNA-[protein]-cysteine methyltransferase